MPNDDPNPPPDRCTLEHRVFTLFGAIGFRRAETDGTPVMVMALGEREATVPLRSLQQEFAIPDASDDGRMLGLIAESLDYVSGLRPGDKLPAEVLDGTASWQPDDRHRRVALSRLRRQLVGWLTGVTIGRQDADQLLRLDDNPDQRAAVQDALARAADALGLGSSEAVVRLMEDIGEELAYIEALRDRLLRRIQAMVAKVERVAFSRRADGHHLETLTQVQRLSALALRQIGGRFDQLDAQTGEVLAALRNADSQRAFIRSNRDWLYRSQRAWDPLLAEWDSANPALDEAMWGLLGRSYQFLAQRFLPATEWVLANRQGRGKEPGSVRMVW